METPKRKFSVRVLNQGGGSSQSAFYEVIYAERYEVENGMHKFYNQMKLENNTWRTFIVLTTPIMFSIIQEQIT
jgi:hypothetical protein